MAPNVLEERTKKTKLHILREAREGTRAFPLLLLLMPGQRPSAGEPATSCLRSRVISQGTLQCYET